MVFCISGLKEDALVGLNNLEQLDLSSNNLHNFSLDISNLTQIQKLIVVNNSISCLSKETFRTLDDLQKAWPSSR